jgi:hypothetical protein
MIEYRRALNSHDYKLCHELMRMENIPKDTLGFPTMMAFEDGELIGMCATTIKNEMIVAGPLTVRSDRRRAFTALQLCVKYEEDLKSLGIVSYIFSAEYGGIMQKAIDRYMHGMKPYADDGKHKFYIRRLDTDQALSFGPVGDEDGQQG